MNENKEEHLGYLKYSGSAIEDGLIDMRKAGDALIGFDKILRHFMIAQDSEWKKHEFELPVRIRKGSLVIIVTGIVTGAVTAAMMAYAAKTGYIAAEKGVANTPFVQGIMKNTLLLTQRVIKIKKHMGIIRSDEVKNTHIQQSQSGIILKNHENKDMTVSPNDYGYYNKCPENLFSPNAEIVNNGIDMEVGVYENGKVIKERITYNDKAIFTSKKPKAEIFPELVHNKIMTLEGKITEVDENNNSMVFSYKEIDLECKPEKGGYIFQFKQNIITKESGGIFGNVKIKGRIDRIDSNGKQKKIVIRIITIDAVEGNQRELL